MIAPSGAVGPPSRALTRGARGRPWRRRLAVALAVLGLSSPALAVDGLAWKWAEGQERRYLVQAAVTVPEALTLWDDENDQPVVTRFTVTLVLRCAPTARLGKAAWELRCDIDDASLRGKPVSLYEGRTAPVLARWAATFRDDVWLELVQGTDGRIKAVEIEGIEGRNRRTNLKVETMRQILRRAVAALDVHLPKHGTDGGAGSWTQRAAMSMSMVSTQGTLGGVLIKDTVLAVQGDAVVIGLEGGGSIISGETNEAVTQSAYKVELVGSVRFDTAKGEVVESQYVANGKPTAGANRAEGVPGTDYDQSVFVRRLAPDEEAPDLGESVEF